MWRIETRRDLDDKEFYAIGRLIDDAAEHDGFRSLSDQLWLELVNPITGAVRCCPGHR